MTKETVWDWVGEDLPPQKVFPLEPLAVYTGQDKLTADTGGELKFWAHTQLAESVFIQLGLLSTEQFHQIARRQVYGALHEVPHMFQIWMCKQVTNIAGINKNLADRESKDVHDPQCPS
jgi:hypothetical protein